MRKKWRIAGINFDHMHMHNLLAHVVNHPHAELAGICHTSIEPMRKSIKSFSLPQEKVFSDYTACMESCSPDIVILCPATGDHGLWGERIAEMGVHVIMEKPFASSLKEADRIFRSLHPDRILAVNWPMAWYSSHRTAHRILQEDYIGSPLEVHYYGGNRGPLHTDDERTGRNFHPSIEDTQKSWWYSAEKGGGSLLDYLGYGVTLGTWYMQGAKPQSVQAVTGGDPRLAVDEHSITIARYGSHLSKFETRWGTFTNPWNHQPQPKCGFIIVGEHGTISSYNRAPSIRVQTKDRPEGFQLPADDFAFTNPVDYVIDCLECSREIEGPLSPSISRIGQEIVDAARESALRGVAITLNQD